jgi:toxin ParE2
VTVRLLAIAAAELDEAVAWYETQARGLGDAFLAEALKTFRLIERHPHAWNPLTDSIRRCRLARFPYGVIYVPQGSDILVLAIAHAHPAPVYWRDRMQNAGR